MLVLDSIQAVQTQVRQWESNSKRIGLVPTMGALHDGHLALVKHISEHCDIVLVSIFVNPSQFGPNEDLTRYPRTLERDIDALKQVAATAVFCPSPQDIYPEGHLRATSIHIPELSDLYCGHSRPGHFDGVCSVVTRLLLLTRASVAIFGEKDFQQLQLIKRMCKDLFIHCDILSHPIVREASGLALSSRNAYLSPSEKSSAASIYAALSACNHAYLAGQTSADALLQLFSEQLSNTLQLEYAAIVDPNTLKAVSQVKATHRLLTAVQLGSTRLIDNIAF